MTDFIEVYDNVLSADFCQDFIKQFNSSPHKVSGRTGGGVDTSKKISEDIYLNEHREFHPALRQIFDATSNALADYVSKYYFSLISGISITLKHPKTGQPTLLTAENFDEVGRPNALHLLRYLYRIAPINAQKYQQGVGNYNYWHSEIYPQPNGNAPLHRVLLFLIYLNDIEEGGETEFFYQQKAIKPKAGSIVIAPCGFTHTHRGNVPLSNDKYVLTSWLMFNPAEQIYTG
ncbi:2OG-Fe(II) oxygenase [Thalassotalea ponticola]|uniref:2OG-Fe(II) oxygenase n=1 Tax=Thalassotalea ponticola TaxID=1523392 RepID=UPI0025B5313D|nr:2OG-Fe(II) oxygenase [Thalassotalea ponticola]MDN3653457.1 2OG-Fe(II) oxygenase [Thalassotalea ponticola]